MSARLGRSTYPAAAAAPVRIVHLGVGAFHRAHQAALTALADPHHEWGIAAFTGRSPAVAEALQPQDGLYSLVERGAETDRVQVVGSLSTVLDGADLVSFARYTAASSTAILSLTVSEAGYLLAPDGRLELERAEIAADIATLAALVQLSDSSFASTLEQVSMRTVPGRVVLGLEARRRSGAGAIAVVPCDNLPSNGRVVGRALIDLAQEVDPALAHWITLSVDFIDTSVDRITPSTTRADKRLVEASIGLLDESPVVTEPFHDWVLGGAFRGDRPRWETAGARFVDDVEPFERRKLWLLNGAHSLLAYAGLARGHRTVAEAVGDDILRGWVEQFWDEAQAHLDPALLDIRSYRAQLLDRFDNARIEHRLEQIASGGRMKVATRIVPVALAERAAGASAEASARAIGAWVAATVDDGAPSLEACRSQLLSLDEDLGRDDDFVAEVHAGAHQLHERKKVDQ